mmetsp:Transcript_22633/g.57949  ORF Transcript_22633/g.57949 Transcript_22633/m.57949 type:complete len:254 (+) Transcript_22633:1655-2416(+)
MHRASFRPARVRTDAHRRLCRHGQGVRAAQQPWGRPAAREGSHQGQARHLPDAPGPGPQPRPPQPGRTGPQHAILLAHGDLLPAAHGAASPRRLLWQPAQAPPASTPAGGGRPGCAGSREGAPVPDPDGACWGGELVSRVHGLGVLRHGAHCRLLMRRPRLAPQHGIAGCPTQLQARYRAILSIYPPQLAAHHPPRATAQEYPSFASQPVAAQPPGSNTPAGTILYLSTCRRGPPSGGSTWQLPDDISTPLRR